MGHRPVDLEPTPAETMTRPQELVQRAKQLAQLASFQFGPGRGVSTMPSAPINTPMHSPLSGERSIAERLTADRPMMPTLAPELRPAQRVEPRTESFNSTGSLTGGSIFPVLPSWD